MNRKGLAAAAEPAVSPGTADFFQKTIDKIQKHVIIKVKEVKSMKVKVIYTATAEIKVSDHYAEMPKLHEKESALAWYVWKALADSLDRELTWKLSKNAEIHRVMTDKTELYEN